MNPTPVKPGYKTTEFWMAVGAALLGIFVAGGFIDDTGTVGKIVGLAVTTLSSLGYTWSRTSAKTSVTNTP